MTRTGFRKKNVPLRRRVALLLVAVVLGLGVAEVLIRESDVDWRYIRKNLYYQRVDHQSHMPVPASGLMFRLKPGTSNDYRSPERAYHVTVNSLGFRGKEATAKKPPGVFRIVCLGGSNVYGATVNDDQTWPAQLEATLNSMVDRPVEVWNMGVSAYVDVQVMILAQEVLARYEPDLLIFALSNYGPRAFLEGADVVPCFENQPELWRNLIPSRILRGTGLLPLSWKLRMLNDWRVFRFALLGLSEIGKTDNRALWSDYGLTDEYAHQFRDFILNAKTKVPVCFFIGPFDPSFPQVVSNHLYFQGTDVRYFYLTAPETQYPSDYRDIHPPARVLTWYGEKIGAWLVETGLVSDGELN